MTQLTLKNRIDNSQMSILLHLFEKTVGIWEDRDIDIKKMRKEIYERRTKNYDNATL